MKKPIIIIALALITIIAFMAYYFTSTESGLKTRIRLKLKDSILSNGGSLETLDQEMDNMTIDELKHLLEFGGG